MSKNGNTNDHFKEHGEQAGTCTEQKLQALVNENYPLPPPISHAELEKQAMASLVKNAQSPVAVQITSVALPGLPCTLIEYKAKGVASVFDMTFEDSERLIDSALLRGVPLAQFDGKSFSLAPLWFTAVLQAAEAFLVQDNWFQKVCQGQVDQAKQGQDVILFNANLVPFIECYLKTKPTDQNAKDIVELLKPYAALNTTNAALSLEALVDRHPLVWKNHRFEWKQEPPAPNVESALGKRVAAAVLDELNKALSRLTAQDLLAFMCHPQTKHKTGDLGIDNPAQTLDRLYQRFLPEPIPPPKTTALSEFTFWFNYESTTMTLDGLANMLPRVIQVAQITELLESSKDCQTRWEYANLLEEARTRPTLLKERFIRGPTSSSQPPVASAHVKVPRKRTAARVAAPASPEKLENTVESTSSRRRGLKRKANEPEDYKEDDASSEDASPSEEERPLKQQKPAAILATSSTKAVPSVLSL